MFRCPDILLKHYIDLIPAQSYVLMALCTAWSVIIIIHFPILPNERKPFTKIGRIQDPCIISNGLHYVLIFVQALAAASKTVDCLKLVHSLHAIFLIAGDNNSKNS